MLWNEVLVTQSCLTVCNPMDCSPPGSAVHGILQERILAWVAILQGIFLTQGFNPYVLHCRFFTVWATREAHKCYTFLKNETFMEKKCGLLSAESLEYIDLQWKRSKIIHSMNVCFLKLFYFWLHWIFALHAGFLLLPWAGDYSLVAVRGLLTAVASLVAACRLWSSGSVLVAPGLSCAMTCEIFSDPGIEAVFPALADGFLPIVSLGKS